MKIAFVVPRFFPYRGGFENYVLKVAQTLKLRGHEVFVLTSTAFDLESFWLPGFRTLPAGREELLALQVHRFPICYRKWLRRAGRLFGKLPDWRLRARFRAPGFKLRGLVRQLRQIQPDVVHIGPLPYTRLMYEGWREAQRCGAEVIATPCVHFGEDDNREVSLHYTQPFQMRLLNECHAVLALTEMERGRLIELGVDPRKIETTAVGVDLAEITGGDSQAYRARARIQGSVILHLGTKASDKGTTSLVEAMKKLWDRGFQGWLVLAGSSTREFDNYIRQQPVLPHLLNLGQISDPEKRDILAAADLLVHPSRVESLGIVYLEAWANAKPVVAADTAVSREIISAGQDGTLVPFGDVNAIAAAISHLAQNRQEREQMGNSGRRKVMARYSWDKVLPGILRVFEGPAVSSNRISDSD